MFHLLLTPNIIPKSKMRVEIPKNLEKLLKLATNINKKHLVDGGNSTLIRMVNYKWEIEGPILPSAQANEAEGYKKKMAAAYRERDLIMANTREIVCSSREVLTGINRDNMKRLGEWGFTVEDSATTGSNNKPSASK